MRQVRLSVLNSLLLAMSEKWRIFHNEGAVPHGSHVISRHSLMPDGFPTTCLFHENLLVATVQDFVNV